jgi:hypothetical protein
MVRSLSFAFTLSTAVMICGISYAGDEDNRISPFPVQQGFDISPVKLNLAGKDPLKVGFGSYLVNAIGDCSGCHSFPQYLEKHAAAGGLIEALSERRPADDDEHNCRMIPPSVKQITLSGPPSL